MEVVQTLREAQNQRYKVYQDFGLADPSLSSLHDTHLAKLDKLEELLKACEAAEARIQEAEGEEFQATENAVLQPILERFGISDSAASLSVTFAEQLTTEKAPEPREQEQAPQEEAEEESLFPPVSSAEFEAIPKYLRGRMLPGELNMVLKGLETILVKKHELMTTPLKNLNNAQKNKVLKWREEDVSKLGDNVCVSEADFRSSLPEKSRHSLKNALPCLRHLKITKEIRVKGVVFIGPYQ